MSNPNESQSADSMIETDRLRLRPHRVADFNRYLPLWLLPEPAATYLPLQLTREEAWARLLRFIGHWSQFSYGLFIVEDLQSGEIVAEVGLARFERGLGPRFDEAPEAAWRVLSTRRGQGIAGEAMTAALAWFDRAHPWSRTVCLIHSENLPSRAVATRLGYRVFETCQFKNHPAQLFERTSAR